MNSQTHVFRYNVFWFAIPCLIGAILGGYRLLLVKFETTVVVLTITLSIGVVQLLAAYWFSPVELDHSGVTVPDGFGIRLRLDWEDIDKVTRFLGGTLVKSKSVRWRSGYIFLVFNQRKLDQMLIELAPEGNPLHEWADQRERKRNLRWER